jgi:2'-5' RNA ligase
VPGLALGDPSWLPPKAPRVLAVDLADGEEALAALQGRVAEAMATAAGYEPEKRPFRPHVTVARTRRGTRLRRPRELSPPRALEFSGEALTLYRSRLGAGGARYEALRRLPLA